MRKGVLFVGLILLIAGVLVLNYFLWKSKEDKWHRIEGLKVQMGLQLKENDRLKERNHALSIDIENLRSPNAYYLYEEKAREDYGFIGQNETFFVLPDSELKRLPDVPGLSGVSKDAYSNIGHTQPQQSVTQPSGHIPVTPIPLQLESLQE